MTKSIFLTLATAAVFTLGARAQMCSNFQKTHGCSQASEEGFIYNSQSKGGLFAKGTSSTMKVVFYSGFDYSISLCVDKMLGPDIGFKLTDAKTGEVLYDNATDNKSLHVEFTCETTRNVNIQISVPGAATSAKKKTADPDDGACLGVLIEQKPSPKVGF